MERNTRVTLSVFALILFALWFGSVLLTKPFDGTQLIAPSVMAVIMVPVFVSIITKETNDSSNDATEIINNLNKNNPATPKPTLQTAIDFGKEEFAKRLARIGK